MAIYEELHAGTGAAQLIGMDYLLRTVSPETVKSRPTAPVVWQMQWSLADHGDDKTGTTLPEGRDSPESRLRTKVMARRRIDLP